MMNANSADKVGIKHSIKDVFYALALHSCRADEALTHNNVMPSCREPDYRGSIAVAKYG